MNLFRPILRPRRLRINKTVRRLVRETRYSIDNFVMPMFITSGKKIKNPLVSMPGIFQYSADQIDDEIDEISKAGIPAVLLFGLPKYKDETGSDAYLENGVIQQTVRKIKKLNPDLCIITDICLCEYTDHGHCGPIKNNYVDNDATLKLIARQAVSHAESGADIVAPSGMMDGMVGAIREALDKHSFENISILSYSVKYASGFYGPFRDAANCAPKFGDRSSYQMDPANYREALKEVRLDIEEGADMVMVKPALPYLDIIRLVKDKFDYPVAAYNVSGEYAMVKAAAKNGWIDESRVVNEILTSIKRAGADIIITYFAKDTAKRVFASDHGSGLPAFFKIKRD